MPAYYCVLASGNESVFTPTSRFLLLGVSIFIKCDGCIYKFYSIKLLKILMVTLTILIYLLKPLLAFLLLYSYTQQKAALVIPRQRSLLPVPQFPTVSEPDDQGINPLQCSSPTRLPAPIISTTVFCDNESTSEDEPLHKSCPVSQKEFIKMFFEISTKHRWKKRCNADVLRLLKAVIPSDS